MSSNFEQWIEREVAGYKEQRDKMQKKMLRSLPLVLLVPAVLLGGIGFAVGGGITLAKQNALVGLLFGLGIDVLWLFLAWLGRMVSDPAKRYRKSLLRQVPSESEQNRLASQMLGNCEGMPEPVVFTYTEEDCKTCIKITKDYIVVTATGSGNWIKVIFLNQVEHVEVDSSDMSYTSKAGNARVHHTIKSSDLNFYYKNSENAKKKKNPDAWIKFPNPELRQQVMDLLQTVTKEGESL